MGSKNQRINGKKNIKSKIFVKLFLIDKIKENSINWYYLLVIKNPNPTSIQSSQWQINPIYNHKIQPTLMMC